MSAPLPVKAADALAGRRDARAILRRIEEGVARVIQGKPDVVRLAVCALAARGHLLIEDVPGVGKTTLARALARAVGGSFKRIQFTSDLLPSDILGGNVWLPETGEFQFKAGPIFGNVVLADEINRTTPRTQSSLLEAMSDGKVSIDGKSWPIPQPFLVVATQNPLEHFGTYPLPESQMDRFHLRLRMGYPDAGAEKRIVTQRATDGIDELEPVVELADVSAAQAAVERVRVDDSLYGYAERVVQETRSSPFLSLGVSTRGFLAWYTAAQAHALMAGRDWAAPDDFKRLALPALAHRVVVGSAAASGELGRAREEAERILSDILDRVPVPT